MPSMGGEFEGRKVILLIVRILVHAFKKMTESEAARWLSTSKSKIATKAGDLSLIPSTNMVEREN